MNFMKWMKKRYQKRLCDGLTITLSLREYEKLVNAAEECEKLKHLNRVCHSMAYDQMIIANQHADRMRARELKTGAC